MESLCSADQGMIDGSLPSVPKPGNFSSDTTNELVMANTAAAVESASLPEITIPFASQFNYPTKDEWEPKRGIIEDLYVKQGMKLDDVRQLMAREHMFIAS